MVTTSYGPTASGVYCVITDQKLKSFDKTKYYIKTLKFWKIFLIIKINRFMQKWKSNNNDKWPLTINA